MKKNMKDKVRVAQPSQTIPEYLYRYRPLKGSLGNAISEAQGKIYCAPPSQLNDPLDGLSNWDPIKGYVKLGVTRDEGWLHWGQASFSESWDNPAMWAHYADAYSGVCFCYCFESIRKIVENRNNEDDLSVKNEQGEKLSIRLDKVKYPPDDSTSFQNNDDTLTTKLTAWSYEKEWRLLIPLKSTNKDEVSGDVFHLENALKKVIIGPTTKHWAPVYDMARHYNEKVECQRLHIDPTTNSLSLKSLGNLENLSPTLQVGGRRDLHLNTPI